jgi:cytidylate kinase
MKSRESIESLLASIRVSLEEQQRHRETSLASRKAPPALPFITISRQAGAGGTTLAHLLVYQLNSICGPPDGPQWAVWDRELVEKVAAEQHIPASLIESLESHRPWLEDLCAAISLRDEPSYKDEFQVYRRVAGTIRALARAGHAVIVGRGGAYATSDLPGGVHVRLVAPLEHRIARMVQQKGLSERKAAAEVRRLDNERENFHRRYWGGKALLPEMFTITLNTAAVCPEKLVDCIMPLVAVTPHAGAGARGGKSCCCGKHDELQVPAAAAAADGGSHA